MKKIIYLLLSVILSYSYTFAQNSSGKGKVVGSGDLGLDSSLTIINNSAKNNLTDFLKDLSKVFNHPLEKIDQMMKTNKMEPADAYMTLQVAKLSGKNVDDVAASFQKNRDKGWGVIAKEMGIKPGSKEFHELKNSSKGKSKEMKDKDDKEKKDKDKDKGGKGNGNGKDKGKKK